MITRTELMEFFATIRDPRIDRGKEHKLVDILVITYCAVFCRCYTWYDIEEFAEAREKLFRQFLELPNGIPSHDTFNRVFQLLDFDEISRLLFEWLSQFQQTDGRQLIHIDGKFLNGSNKDAGNSRSSLGMVSAYASETGLCLLSTMTRLEKDEGEKKSMEKLIDGLSLKKAIVTIDAAGATPTIVEKIVKKGGDYLIALKNNQKSFFTLAEEHFRWKSSCADTFSTEEKSHGRIDKRIYEQLLVDDVSESFAISLKKQKEKFPHLTSIIRVKSLRTVGTKPSAEKVRYYFSSLKSDAREAGNAIRSHWSIENKLHWVLDVHFREDHCRTRTGQADANLALIRRLAVSVIKQVKPEKKTINSMTLRCSLLDDELLKMLKLSAF